MTDVEIAVLVLDTEDTEWCEICGDGGGLPARLTFPDGSRRALWAHKQCLREGGRPLALALDLQTGDWLERAKRWANDDTQW